MQIETCQKGFCVKLFKYILALSLTPALLKAQDIKDMPSIAYIYPAGVEQGKTIDIIIGGRNYTGVVDIIVSGEGVKATIESTLIPAERNRGVGLRNKLHGLLINRGILRPEDANLAKLVNNADCTGHPDLLAIKEQINYENKLYDLGQSSQSAFAETIHIKLEVDKDAKLGKRTMKVVSKEGVSNSMPFYIDDLTEHSERSIRDKSYGIIFKKEGNASLLPNKVLSSEQAKMFAKQEALVQDVTLPVILNGQVDLLQTDIYRFEAKKGQEIVAFVRARDLIYYIGDGVPGWFQAAISIRNSQGKEIAYVDDFFQNPDPLLVFTAPETDEYTLEIKDAIFRGREDFVYRITLGELPFITRTYPLGGSMQSGANLKLYGYNLNRDTAKIEQKLKPSYNELLLAKGDEKQSKILYQATSLESVDFAESNNTSKANAESIKLYQSANSILRHKGEKHFYEFHTQNDTKVVAEVFARRLGSPIDTYIEVFDSTMQLIGSSDDLEDFSDGLNTHHADSKIAFETKANELYYIVLRDAQNKAGNEYAYRLNLYEPKPDFEAKASPSTINVVQGKSTPFNISVFRKNEGKFPIEIRIKNAPKGISISGTEIDANAENVMAVLHCSKDLDLNMHEIELEAFITVDGKEIAKDIIPCEDMLQAFYYPHLVPTFSQNVYVISPSLNPAYKNADKIGPIEARSLVIPDEIKIPLGGETQINIGMYGSTLKKGVKTETIHAELRDSSQGITIEKVLNDKYGCTVTLKSNADICKVGQSANIIIDVYTSATKGKKLKIDTLKAIKYIITE